MKYWFTWDRKLKNRQKINKIEAQMYTKSENKKTDTQMKKTCAHRENKKKDRHTSYDE